MLVRWIGFLTVLLPVWSLPASAGCGDYWALRWYSDSCWLDAAKDSGNIAQLKLSPSTIGEVIAVAKEDLGMKPNLNLALNSLLNLDRKLEEDGSDHAYFNISKAAELQRCDFIDSEDLTIVGLPDCQKSYNDLVLLFILSLVCSGNGYIEHDAASRPECFKNGGFSRDALSEAAGAVFAKMSRDDPVIDIMLTEVFPDIGKGIRTAQLHEFDQLSFRKKIVSAGSAVAVASLKSRFPNAAGGKDFVLMYPEGQTRFAGISEVIAEVSSEVGISVKVVAAETSTIVPSVRDDPSGRTIAVIDTGVALSEKDVGNLGDSVRLQAIASDEFAIWANLSALENCDIVSVGCLNNKVVGISGDHYEPGENIQAIRSSDSHLAELIEGSLGVHLVERPYETGSVAAKALQNGEVDLVFANPLEAKLIEGDPSLVSFPVPANYDTLSHNGAWDLSIFPFATNYFVVDANSIGETDDLLRLVYGTPQWREYIARKGMTSTIPETVDHVVSPWTLHIAPTNK